MLLSLVLILSQTFTEVAAFNYAATTGNYEGETRVYVNNFDWDDQWGWCKGESQRQELGRPNSQKDCNNMCKEAKWNDKIPRGCEYSGNYRTCNVFFGAGVRSSQAGSSYRCSINIARGVSFSDAEEEVGCPKGMDPVRGGGCRMAGETSVAQDRQEAAFQVPTAEPVSVLTYGFALIGAGFLVFQASQMCVNKGQHYHSPTAVEQEI